MKSGASDPFADDAEESESASGDESGDAGGVSETSEESGTSEASEMSGAVEGTAEMDEGVEGAAEELAEDAVDDEIERSDVPWVLRRDAVKDDRPHVHQLFVRADTDGKARRAESRLEERLDTDVYRLDAREAIYLVGMEHLDEVADLLEEWGYNF